MTTLHSVPKKRVSHLTARIKWQNIISYVGHFRWLRIKWFNQEFRKKIKVFGKNGINYVFFFWLFTLLTLCSTFSLDHFRKNIRSSSSSNSLQQQWKVLIVTSLKSLLFSAGLFIHRCALTFLITNKKVQWEENLAAAGRVLFAAFCCSFCACQTSSRTRVICAQRDFFQSCRWHKEQHYWALSLCTFCSQATLWTLL